MLFHDIKDDPDHQVSDHKPQPPPSVFLPDPPIPNIFLLTISTTPLLDPETLSKP